MNDYDQAEFEFSHDGLLGYKLTIAEILSLFQRKVEPYSYFEKQ